VLRILVGALLNTILLSLAANAQPVSRVELTDGTIFENVTIEVDNTYKVITIYSGEERRTVSFTDVNLVLDLAGNDVTKDVLGKYYRAPEAGPAQTPFLDEAAQPCLPRQWPLYGGFSAYGNFSMPVGKGYEGITPSFGFGLDGFVAVGKQYALRASISKAGTGVDVGEMVPGAEVLSSDLSLSVWRYFLCLQYHDWPDWRGEGKMLYYACAGLGVVTHKFSGTAIYVTPIGGDLSVLHGDERTDSKLSYTFGLGMIAELTSRLGLNVATNLDLVFVGAHPSGSTFGGNVQINGIFDLRVGLTYLIRTHNHSGDTGLNPGRQE